MTKKTYDTDPALRLRQASNEGDLEEIKKIPKLDEIIDLSGSASGQTALHRATINDRAAVVEFLVSKGANPEIKDKLGKTPSDLAKGQSGSFLKHLDLAKKAISFSQYLAKENNENVDKTQRILNKAAEQYKAFIRSIPKTEINSEQKNMFRQNSPDIFNLNFMNELVKDAHENKDVRAGCQERSTIGAAYFLANTPEQVSVDFLRIRGKNNTSESHQIVLIHKEGQETDALKIARSDTAVFLDPYESGAYYTNKSIPKDSCLSDIFNKKSIYNFTVDKQFDLSQKSQDNEFVLKNYFAAEKSRLLKELKKTVSEVEKELLKSTEKSNSHASKVKKGQGTSRFH